MGEVVKKIMGLGGTTFWDGMVKSFWEVEWGEFLEGDGKKCLGMG